MKSIVIALPQPEQNEPDFNDAYISEHRPSIAAIFVRKYGLAVLFAAFLLSGMIFGAVRSSQLGDSALTVIDRFLLPIPDSAGETAPLTVFADSFCVSFLFAAALFLSAVSPVGILLVPAVMFFRGYEFGLLSGYLCALYGFPGLAYFISVLLAGTFFSALSLVYLSQYCVVFSCSMLLAILDNISFGGKTLRAKFRELTLNAAYSLMLIVLASLADTALYFLIGRFFTF